MKTKYEVGQEVITNVRVTETVSSIEINSHGTIYHLLSGKVYPEMVLASIENKPTQPIAPQEDKAKFSIGQRVIATDNTGRIIKQIATILDIDKSDPRTPFKVVFDERGLIMWCHSGDVEPYTEPSLTVTREMLVKLGACSSGLAEFDKKFPSGKGELEEVCKATDVSNSCWLHNHRFSISTMQNEQPKSKYESMSNDELKRLACGISELCCPTSSNKKRKSDCPFYHTRCEVTNENRSEIIQYLIDEETPEPEKEPEPVYYNGKVVCVKTDGDGTFTVGKVYEFVDGKVLDNKRDKRPTGMKMKSLNDGYLANWYYRFIPYLGEA